MSLLRAAAARPTTRNVEAEVADDMDRFPAAPEIVELETRVAELTADKMKLESNNEMLRQEALANAQQIVRLTGLSVDLAEKTVALEKIIRRQPQTAR